MVGAREVDADDHAARARVDRARDRPDRLGEGGAGTAVQQAIGLGVALDRHGCLHPTGFGGSDDDAHALREAAGTGSVEPVDQVVDHQDTVGEAIEMLDEHCLAAP